MYFTVNQIKHQVFRLRFAYARRRAVEDPSNAAERAFFALAILPMDARYGFIRRYLALELDLASGLVKEVDGPGNALMRQAIPHLDGAVEALRSVEDALFCDGSCVRDTLGNPRATVS